MKRCGHFPSALDDQPESDAHPRLTDISNEHDMTTDQLIDLLVADLKPVDHQRTARALGAGLLVGSAAAFAAMLLILGPDPRLLSGQNLDLLSVKLLFTLSVVATGAALLPHLARPAPKQRGFLMLVSLPFLVILVLAIIALTTSQWPTWGVIIVGKDWLTCLIAIPLFAIVPFSAIVLAMRMGAPTDQECAGAVAALVASGLGAAACGLACPDNSIPSIALSYGLTIGICAAFGAGLGPRLLRW